MPHDDNEALPFTTDVFGRFPPSAVRVTYDPTPRPTTDKLEALIAEEWDRQTAIAEEIGRLLFNGETFRYVRHEVERPSRAGDPPVTPPARRRCHKQAAVPQQRRCHSGEEIFHVTVGPTSYRDFVGTNLYNHHRLGEFDWSFFANPVGTTATLITSDNLICYGRRSGHLAYHAGHIHTFGGSLEGQDMAADGSIDPFASLCRELREELAIRRDELADLYLVGLIRDKEICQPEMLYEARLDLTADELRQRWRTAEHRDEHDAIVTIPYRPEAIVPFIHASARIAPVAIAALFLLGRRAWGDNWFDRVAADLHTPHGSGHTADSPTGQA